MTRIYETREIADKDGNVTGTFRRTVRSDDEKWIYGLCNHVHDSREEADKCEIAIRAEGRWPTQVGVCSKCHQPIFADQYRDGTSDKADF